MRDGENIILKRSYVYDMTKFYDEKKKINAAQNEFGSDNQKYSP